MYYTYLFIVITILVSPWSILPIIFLDGQFTYFPGFFYNKDAFFMLFRILIIYTPFVIVLFYNLQGKKSAFKLPLLLANLLFIFILFHLFVTKITTGLLLTKYSIHQIYEFIFLTSLLLGLLLSSILLFLKKFLKKFIHMIIFILRKVHCLFKDIFYVASKQKKQVLISLIIVSIIYFIIYYVVYDLYVIVNN